MKKLLFIIATALFPLVSPAQKTDSVSALRFVYEFSKPGSEHFGNDRENLDVLPNGSSHFYSIYDTRYHTVTTSEEEAQKEVDDMKSRKMGEPWQVFINGTDNELTFITTVPDNFYYKEKDQAPEWIFDDQDTMTVCGYVCKKATTSYGGRCWTAWFAEDLPIPLGPWKLFGLPGLILSANDADSLYQFTCIGMEQATIAPWKIETKGYTQCTNKEYQKQLRLEAADPSGYLLRKLGISPESIVERTVRDQNGNIIEEDKRPKGHRLYMEKLPEDKE